MPPARESTSVSSPRAPRQENSYNLGLFHEPSPSPSRVYLSGILALQPMNASTPKPLAARKLESVGPRLASQNAQGLSRHSCPNDVLFVSSWLAVRNDLIQ